MDNPFGELPVLPVVVPLALVVCAALLRRLRIRHALTPGRAVLAAVIGVYAAGIVGNSIFPIFLDPPPQSEPWTSAIALIPFVDYEVEDALVNMLVFVPIGIIVALLLRRPTWWRVIALAAGVSLGVELMQLAAQRFFAGGHIADVDDLLFNVAGGALGYLLFVLVERVPRGRAIIDGVRWRVREPGDPAPSVT